jgi:hypothetical protein
MKRIVVSLLLVTVLAPAWLSARQSGEVLPALSFIEASGCDGLFLYAWNAARTEVLTVRVDRNKIALADGTTTVNLATAGEDAAVRIEVTATRRDSMPFCSELGQPTSDRPAIWLTKAGTLKIIARRRGVAPMTAVSVMLDDLVLVSPAGIETRAKRTVRFTAAVSDLTP